MEFLDDAERFFKIKNIVSENNKINILNVLLQGRARVWLELQVNGFQSFAQFREGFLREFFSVPTQVKIKTQWANRRFVDQEDNLQTYFYKQLKETSFLRPEMSQFEKITQ